MAAVRVLGGSSPVRERLPFKRTIRRAPCSTKTSGSSSSIDRIRGASPLGLPHTLSRAPLRRRAPFPWLTRWRSFARIFRHCGRKAGPEARQNTCTNGIVTTAIVQVGAEQIGEPVPVPTVGVVITTYNHAHFLGEALASVCAQTRAADAIVVVDDGSDDDPAEVVARFRGVRCIRQDNRGLAAARNAGLRASSTRYVMFLDADDRLEPRAIEEGLACFGRAPDSGFVYGGHLFVDRDGNKTGERFEPPGESAYLHLLRC